MNEHIDENSQVDKQSIDDNQYEAYGWDFHKKPLMYAAIITALFYAFVFFYVSI
ncbi:MAG: hypothetical protein P9L94_20395 [Candidatus Hinthialibacter antarcticus]|nr:hypothetical protein [Candidatus Hinthialibacter antarcticus]